MIQQLLTYLNDDWRTLTAGETPAPGLTLTLGTLELNQRTLDRSGRVQPQPIQQHLALRLPGVTAYALAQTPLDGTLDAEALIDPETVSERRQALFPGDFTIDAPSRTLHLSAAGAARCAGAAQLAVGYRYPGVVATQEFTQHFEAAINAESWRLVEQWSALFLALVVTDAEALLARCNQALSATPYSAGGFSARQSLEQLTLLAGASDAGSSTPLVRLQGQVRGRLALGKASPPAFGLIEQVISPGRGDNGQAVNVEIGVAFRKKQS
jgi:hypothetical protein